MYLSLFPVPYICTQSLDVEKFDAGFRLKFNH
jgi:hypothetical protein